MTKSPFASLRSARGSAMVEMGIALPFLVAIVLGATDFARVAYAAIELTDAVRAGAQYGAHDVGNSLDSTGMRNTATNAAPNLTGVTAEAFKSCLCAQDDGTGTPWPAASCTAPTATACLVGSHRIVSVTVTASKTFTTISRYPGIPSTLNLSRSATLRVTE